MGAKDYGIFDDDTAYDILSQINENAYELFGGIINKCINSSYVSYEDGIGVLITAAFIDHHQNGSLYRNDNEESDGFDNINNFRNLYSGTPLTNLRYSTLEALDKILSNSSELNEVWKENEELYPLWCANILALKERI